MASWEGLFVPGWLRFRDGFMVPSGRCGMGGPNWHRARGGKGAPGHSGELPPAVDWPWEKSGVRVGLSPARPDKDPVNGDVAPFHGWNIEAQRVSKLPKVTPDQA